MISIAQKLLKRKLYLRKIGRPFRPANCILFAKGVEIGALVDGAQEPGQQLDAGQTVAEIARAEDLCSEILVSEDAIAHLAPGQAATYTRSDDPDETALGAVIGDISFVAGDGSYRVTILPDDPSNLPLGLDVAVRLGE